MFLVNNQQKLSIQLFTVYGIAILSCVQFYNAYQFISHRYTLHTCVYALVEFIMYVCIYVYMQLFVLCLLGKLSIIFVDGVAYKNG